jgi:hypothetical protein
VYFETPGAQHFDEEILQLRAAMVAANHNHWLFSINNGSKPNTVGNDKQNRSAMAGFTARLLRFAL